MGILLIILGLLLGVLGLVGKIAIEHRELPVLICAAVLIAIGAYLHRAGR